FSVRRVLRFLWFPVPWFASAVRGFGVENVRTNELGTGHVQNSEPDSRTPEPTNREPENLKWHTSGSSGRRSVLGSAGSQVPLVPGSLVRFCGSRLRSRERENQPTGNRELAELGTGFTNPRTHEPGTGNRNPRTSS